MRRMFMLAVGLLLLAACGGDAADDAPDDQPLTDRDIDVTGNWALAGGTLDEAPFPLVPTFRITMSLEDGRVGGTAACNSYGGDYDLAGWSITIGPLSITEMACQPNVMESEQAFMGVLQRPLTLARDGDTLSMMGDGVDLEFSIIPPVDPAALVGTVWQLETIVLGDAAIQFVGQATLVLNEDGSIEGSTGCRTLSGSYVISGDQLRFTELSAEGDCPAELAEQDGRVISVLEAARIEIDGIHLRLSSAGGEGLDYVAAS